MPFSFIKIKIGIGFLKKKTHENVLLTLKMHFNVNTLITELNMSKTMPCTDHREMTTHNRRYIVVATQQCKVTELIEYWYVYCTPCDLLVNYLPQVGFFVHAPLRHSLVMAWIWSRWKSQYMDLLEPSKFKFPDTTAFGTSKWWHSVKVFEFYLIQISYLIIYNLFNIYVIEPIHVTDQ